MTSMHKIKYKIKQIRMKDSGYGILKRPADFRPENLDRPFYPSDERLSFLASLTYRSTFEALPDDWKLLTKGKNNKDGYFGAAFFHEESRQLVISHRGTNDFKDAMEDFKGVVFNKYTHQIHSACTFAFLVLNKLETKDISISITGHSLGAWLAQITAFAIKYLTVEGDRLGNLEKSKRIYHPHTVTFDSPGCYEMLCKLSNDYFPEYDNEELIQELDITNYFIAPNKVNASNHHVGKSLCFQFESIEFEGNNFLRSIFRPTATHTLDFHNSDNFVQAFRNCNKILKVAKWPTYRMTKMLKDTVTNAWDYVDYQFTKVVLRTDVKFAPSQTDEYTLCRRYLNESNNFRPDLDRLKKENVDLPYKIENYDETVENVSVFKKDEISFLECWKKLERNQIRPGKIMDFLNKNSLESFGNFLPDFEIFNGEIKCKDVKKLKQVVNRVKWLFVFFPEVSAIMRSQISVTASLFEAVTE